MPKRVFKDPWEPFTMRTGWACWLEEKVETGTKWWTQRPGASQETIIELRQLSVLYCHLVAIGSHCHLTAPHLCSQDPKTKLMMEEGRLACL
ncbi:putative Non-Functional Immunoglobulin Kappa Variable 1D-42 [Manis pentadactyla]|nr:putative Non-Functional Immunoglobulin Kappa Variable 1D-42 [Manis pentadactyla]